MIASFFGLIFGTIWTTLKLAAVGGVIGAASLAGGRLVGGLQGFIVAAALGAMLVVGVYGSGYLGAASDARNAAEIAQLKIEKAKLQKDFDVQVAANAKQDEITANQAKQLEADKASMDKIQALIKSHEGDASACVFPDELDAIFK